MVIEEVKDKWTRDSSHFHAGDEGESSLSSLSLSDFPLVIDLDGTLIRTDSLHENFLNAVLQRPDGAIGSLASLLRGRAAFKRALAAQIPLNPASLCYRQSILSMIEDAKASGGAVYLVTAADQQIADSVQAHLGCFDGVKGSDGIRNLKGREKLAWIEENFPSGFIYAGDSKADLALWRAATGAILVGKGTSYADEIAESGIPLMVVKDNDCSTIKSWLREFRPHQWSKNLLIFIPMFAAHLSGNISAIRQMVAAFFIFSMLASATYVINDLFDLAADRQHPTKRFRPLASGAIPPLYAAMVAVTMVAGGLFAGAALSPTFAILMSSYTVMTLAYSARLKTVPMLDVAMIGGLFTLRVLMGSVLLGLPLSPWLNSFSVFFFFSLALAKRHGEIISAKGKGGKRRGYNTDDWPLTLALGTSSAMAAIVILLLFIVEEAQKSGVYSSPSWLFGAPLCVFLWVLRIWLLSSRGELHDDPVIFAVRDRVSYLLGSIVVACVALAS